MFQNGDIIHIVEQIKKNFAKNMFKYKANHRKGDIN